MTLETFNQLEKQQAIEELMRCCGSMRWATIMASSRPFRSVQDLYEAADRVWESLTREDWLEAFGHHPRIGDVESLRTKFATTRAWASNEQAGAAVATEEVLAALAEGNRAYEERFGYLFIICATGKSADEMLALLRDRLGNDPHAELSVAAREQSKITRLRLEKLLSHD
ncbi:MAG TPA: 2-oxo-4-hydroxy-4-carboxy-5-ureidoimidazoline decarboxylase [Stenomitos sp.]